MRLGALILLLCLSACFFVGALATNDKNNENRCHPSFQGAWSHLDSQGNLIVDFKESLCRRDDVTYKLTGKVKAVWICVKDGREVWDEHDSQRQRAVIEKELCIWRRFCPIRSGWFWKVYEDITSYVPCPENDELYCPRDSYKTLAFVTW